MSGYGSSFFRHDCTASGCFIINNGTNWDELITCFPRNIRPTDVDGMVEIRGSFLFLEEKGLGASPNEGQRIALKRLSRNPRTTVILFRPGTETEYQVLIFRDGCSATEGWQGMTKSDFMQYLSGWAEKADSYVQLPPMSSELHERIVQLEAQVEYLKLEYMALARRPEGGKTA